MIRASFPLPLLLAATLLAPTPAGAREYRIDRNHSNLGFAAPILGGLSKVRGKFSDFTVQLNFDAADPAASSLRAVIKPASIDTGIADRDEHLRSPDFFDVAKFPEAVFESTRIEKAGAGFVAHGRLTIRGVTRELDLPFVLTGRNETAGEKGRMEVLGFSATARIDRRDYGMVWKHSVDPLFVGDEIDIEITIITRATPLAPPAGR